MEIAAAFILALLISLIFAIRNKMGSSLTEVIIFFFILFMAGLAGQFWIVPFGPILWGVSWFPLLSILLIVTLLFAAPPPYSARKTKPANEAGNASGAVVVSLLIWILLIVLLAAILIGYAKKRPQENPLIPQEKISLISNLNN